MDGGAAALVELQRLDLIGGMHGLAHTDEILNRSLNLRTKQGLTFDFAGFGSRKLTEHISGQAGVVRMEGLHL